MAIFALPVAKDVLVWLVVLASGAGDFDMPPAACQKYLEHYIPGLNGDAVSAIASPDENNLQKIVALLESDEYPKRLAAEKTLLAAGPDAIPYLKKVQATHPDINVRFVLEQIVGKLAEPSVAADSVAYRMLAIRLVSGRDNAELERILTPLLSGRPFCVERLALLRLIEREKDAAAPVVLAYLEKNGEALAKNRPSHLVDIYGWLGSSSYKDNEGCEVILPALLKQAAFARGTAAPALLDAINKRGSRADVLKSFKMIYRGGTNVMQENGAPASFVAKFAEALLPPQKEDGERIPKWLEDAEANDAADKLAADKWNDALARLFSDYRARMLSTERAEVASMLPADSFLAACVDVDALRRAPVRQVWIDELFGPINYTLAQKMKELILLSDGFRANRIYLSLSGDVKFDAKLLLDLAGGVLNAGLFADAFTKGSALVVIKGEFDRGKLVGNLKNSVQAENAVAHGDFTLFRANGLTIAAMDESTLVIGYDGADGSAPAAAALDAFAARGKAEKPAGLAALLDKEPTDKVFWAVVEKPFDHVGLPAAATRLNVEMEAGDGFALKASLQCATEEDARLVATLLSVFFAFTKEKMPEAGPQGKLFAGVYEKLVVSLDGSVVLVNVKVDKELSGRIIRHYSNTDSSRYVIGGEEVRPRRTPPVPQGTPPPPFGMPPQGG